MSPLIPSILGLAVLGLAACSTAAPTEPLERAQTAGPNLSETADMAVYSSIERLSAASDLVVVGTVKEVVARELDYGSEGPREGQRQGLPVVLYEVEVNETLRGKAGATVIMAAPDVDEISMGGEATALRSGQQVLLFLVRGDAPGITAYDNYYVTVSLDNGVFDRLDGDLVTPRMVGTLEETEYRLSEVRGKVMSDGSLRPLLLAQPSPDWTLVEAPGWAYVPGFSLRLPPGWELNELQGIDSYVGEVVGDNVRLEFDYGAYSWTLDPAEDPERVYAVAYEGIGGVEAKLVIPTGDSGGYTGIYFENLGGQSFNLVGEDLTPEQQQTAIAIFRSIRSLGRSGSTKDPDQVTLKGPGVIRHDWDHAPLINGVRKIIQGTRVDGVCVYTYRMFRGPNDPPKIQRTLASNPDTCEELVEEGTLAYPAGNELEDAAMESVTAIPRDQATSLGVELVAIDSHWDNNGIALWWEGIDIEVSHWIVERSTDADGPWEMVTIRTPSELPPEDDPLKYARVWDSELPPGHHYYYRLFACTNEGRTGYSNVVEATVPDFMPGLVPPIKERVKLTAPC